MNTTTDFMVIENEVRAVASAFGIGQLWLMTNGEIHFYDRERHLKPNPCRKGVWDARGFALPIRNRDLPKDQQVKGKPGHTPVWVSFEFDNTKVAEQFEAITT